MNDQLAINQAGEIVSQPLTWDGEPIYSPSTIREGLFSPDAFEQMPGQTSMEVDDVNAPENVEQRRAMFTGFGWSVTR